MSNFTKKDEDNVWEKGIILDGWNPDEYRLDAAGAMMIRSHRGTNDIYDWEIDHVYPKDKLNKMHIPEDMWDNLDNLRPFNAKNNAKKSTDYPQYIRALVFDEVQEKNIGSEVGKVVNENVQNAVNRCFGFSFEIIKGKHSLK